jgi:hypothetical protein
LGTPADLDRLSQARFRDLVCGTSRDTFAFDVRVRL